MALGYLPPELAADGTDVAIEINCRFNPATVTACANHPININCLRLIGRLG